MAEKDYNREQLENAERLLDALERVPKEKQDTAIRIAQAVLIGASLESEKPDQEGG